jgi:aconitate hydratase
VVSDRVSASGVVVPVVGSTGDRAAGEPAAPEDGANVTAEHIEACSAELGPKAEPDTEIQFTPARVLLQDFTGVPCVVDLAAMRDAMARSAATRSASTRWRRSSWSSTTRCRSTSSAPPRRFELNVEIEFERNRERYQFLRWGQTAFDNFKVVPPGTGIVHQVNLEYLASVVMVRGDVAYPDTSSAPTRTPP